MDPSSRSLAAVPSRTCSASTSSVGFSAALPYLDRDWRCSQITGSDGDEKPMQCGDMGPEARQAQPLLLCAAPDQGTGATADALRYNHYTAH